MSVSPCSKVALSATPGGDCTVTMANREAAETAMAAGSRHLLPVRSSDTLQTLI